MRNELVKKEIELANQKRGYFISQARLKKKESNKKNFTQAAIANALGISEKNYSKLETIGQGLDSIHTLQKIADILNISLNEIINGEKNSDSFPDVSLVDYYRKYGESFDFDTLIEIMKLSIAFIEKQKGARKL